MEFSGGAAANFYKLERGKGRLGKELEAGLVVQAKLPMFLFGERPVKCTLNLNYIPHVYFLLFPGKQKHLSLPGQGVQKYKKYNSM